MPEFDRNNTNFPIENFEYLKKLNVESEWDFLKYYQYLVKEYIKNVHIGSRGLLLYHGMGMGKTMEGVAITMDAIDDKSPIILLTKSLYENFKKDILKYMELRSKHDQNYKLGLLPVKDLNSYIDKKYGFVSMNASNMMKQMIDVAEGEAGRELDNILESKLGNMVKLGSLDNKLLVIDEAHNFFRAVTNGSKNAIALYDMVLEAKNLSVILLTRTPIANDPFELSVCFNMLAGTKNTAVLPTNYGDFYKYYVDEGKSIIKNKAKFQNRLFGLVSHVTHNNMPKTDKKQRQVEFPESLPLIVEKVPMDPEQYVMYLLAREKELEEGKRGFSPNQSNIPAMVKPKNNRASSYRVKSRQISNYSVPTNLFPGKYSDINPNDIPEVYVNSPKLRALFANLKKSPGLALIYSQFVGIGGLGIIQRYLKLHGYLEYKSHIGGKVRKMPPYIYDIDFINNQTVPSHDGAGEFNTDYLDVLMEKMGGGNNRFHQNIIASRRTDLQNNTAHKNTSRKKREEFENKPLAVDSKRVRTVVFDVKIRKGKIDEIIDTYKKSQSYKPIMVEKSKSKMKKSLLPESLLSPFEVYIAEHIDKLEHIHLVGYIILSFAADDYIEPIDMHVFKEYRSFGIGSMLFSYATDLLEKSTADTLRMRAFEPWQRKFGEALGAEVIDTVNNIYIMEYSKEQSVTGGGISKISSAHIFTDDDKHHNIKKLIELTKNNEIKQFNPRYWEHYLNDYTWKDDNGEPITPKMVMNSRLRYKTHYDRIMNADVNYPVILTPDKEHIVDGVHRLAKCFLDNCDHMSCVVASNEQLSQSEEKAEIKTTRLTLGKSKKTKKTGGANDREKKAKRFAVISGDVGIETRKQIQDAFNSEENKYGGIIDVLLISSTGAEGLDLKNIRQIHIFEPYWNYGRIAQVVARGVRNDSHIALKPDERTVQPYIYLSIETQYIQKADIDDKLMKQAMTVRDVERLEPTTDVSLYEESMKNSVLIDSFLQALREVSIECMLIDETKCHKCNPNSVPLYLKDFDLDVKSANPCLEYKAQNVEAEEIIINGNKYYFVRDSSSIYDYQIFEYDETLNGYRNMPSNTALFLDIIEKIKSHTKQ